METRMITITITMMMMMLLQGVNEDAGTVLSSAEPAFPASPSSRSAPQSAA